MSFKDFDKGLTAEEVRQKISTEKEESLADIQFRRSMESEQVLNFLRKVKANGRMLDKMKEALWRKVFHRR